MKVRKLLPTSVAIAVTALAVGACGGGSGAESGSCASAIQFNGELYLGLALRIPPGDPAGTGVVPACDDEDQDREVTVLRLEGISPAIAVTWDGALEEEVFVAPGYFTVLPSHPLHDALRRRAGGFPRPRGCTSRFSGTAVVTRTPTSNDVRVRIGGRHVVPRVHEATRIVGFRRAAQPYLQRGDFVRIRGRRCELPDAEGGLVVDIIRPAP